MKTLSEPQHVFSAPVTNVFVVMFPMIQALTKVELAKEDVGGQVIVGWRKLDEEEEMRGGDLELWFIWKS